MDILKEEDFDGILWDANDDVDEKVISSEINNGSQHEEINNNRKNEGQQQGTKATSIHNNGNQVSGISTVDPERPLLDLSTQRTFASIDMDDTLEHPFLNSFVSTFADKSSSQETPSNILNASTGLPIFTSTSSSNDGTNTTLHDSKHFEDSSSLTQNQASSTTTVMNNEYENMLFQSNYLTSWEQPQPSTQQLPSQKNDFFSVNKNNNQNLQLSHLAGNKWNVIQPQNSVNSNAIANTKNGTIPPQGILSNNRPGMQNKSHHISDSESMANTATEKRTKSKSSASDKQKYDLSREKAQVPPFFLFDAPVELRHNFLKAQQAHNIPANIQDSNAFHYGLAVNAFQPIIKYKDNRVRSLTMLNSIDDIINPHGKKVELLDARQKKSKKGNDRNEREQQRAQKITELIDTLRLTMVQSGWKVEMKSKYQILSTCGEYLNHLKSITKEKEEKLEKTKADLALRQQKLKEDKSLQDSRSDPESVISSLTAFSTNSSNDNAIINVSSDVKKSDQNKSIPSPSGFSSDQIGNKCNILTSESSSDQVATKKQCIDDGSGISSDSGHKGHHIAVNKMSSSDGSGSSSDGVHKGAHIAVNKMSSSVSDMTDSNKGSSDGKTSTETNLKPKLLTSTECCSIRSGEVEVSSTAAVVSGIGSQKHGHTHADIVIKTGQRKRKRKHEPTSLDEGFVLNYQEVFMTSNVPQIISTLAGRIITSNDCFYRVTGLSQQQMKRITLFSLIQADKLSKLYELVAESIADNKSTNNNCLSIRDHQPFTKTITLPCIHFPKVLPLNPANNCQFCLYMNVCFIWNENPIKRCFHCAFYDKIDNNEEEGYVSAEMLSILDSM